MNKSGLTVHMVVKNEDQWVWFALRSVLPYADHILVTDTGSTDKTVEVIQSIDDPKIDFRQGAASTPTEVTAIRQDQIKRTETPWIWVVDGDEVYTDQGAQEVVTQCQDKQKDIGVIKRSDLLGDIYHKQRESVGTYRLYGQSGHLLIRCVRVSAFPGLIYAGDYPNEGLRDGNGINLIDYDSSRVWTSRFSLYHAMYLKRSSNGANIRGMFNRSKYKIEKGIKVTGITPQVFSLSRPHFVPDPYKHRTFLYECLASLITPMKQMKRKFL